MNIFKNSLFKAIYKYIFYSSSNNIDNILVSSKILLAYSSPGETSWGN